jgi:hypothetical protein
MAITYELLETFTGSRDSEMPDPDNEGETITTTSTGVRDVSVRFSCDDTDPVCTHERMVNVCFDADGVYDATATAECIVQVGNGVARKIAVGVIT